jgi:hypothetical protein
MSNSSEGLGPVFPIRGIQHLILRKVLPDGYVSLRLVQLKSPSDDDKVAAGIGFIGAWARPNDGTQQDAHSQQPICRRVSFVALAWPPAEAWHRKVEQVELDQFQGCILGYL